MKTRFFRATFEMVPLFALAVMMIPSHGVTGEVMRATLKVAIEDLNCTGLNRDSSCLHIGPSEIRGFLTASNF